jgi:hypothetical protein
MRYAAFGEPRLNPLSNWIAHADGPGFGGATSMDMSMYMEMFMRHNEIRRTVEEIPGGVRTTTESDSPDLAAKPELRHACPRPEEDGRTTNASAGVPGIAAAPRAALVRADWLGCSMGAARSRRRYGRHLSFSVG